MLSLQDRKMEPFGGIHSSNPINATFSPDGRWVAYGSDESGTDAVYVQPFPATGAKYQISRGDGPHHPLWSRDGKQLFYVPAPAQFEVVRVTTQSGFSVGAPAAAPRGFTVGNAPTDPRSHDVAPDGRILGIGIAGQGAAGSVMAQHVEFVINWFEELKARVPTR